MRLVQVACVVLFAIPALYWLLLSLGVALPYIMLSRLHILILLSGELLIGVFLVPRYASSPRNAGTVGLLTRDFLLVNTIFLFPFYKFYTYPVRSEIPIIHDARPYVVAFYWGLILFTGILLFILGDIRRAHVWITGQIDTQRSRDIEAEAVRGDVFRTKYSRLAGIPLLGIFAKCVYREGTVYALVFSILAIMSLVLRLWKLGDLPPYIDELNHLNTARDLLQGLPLSQVEYRRSLYTVTLPVYLMFKVFGVDYWAAKLPGVLASILAMFPLYTLAKRVNKPAALLAVGLFTFSPWVIAVSRNIREYAFYPLIFYSVGLVMVKLYEALPERIDFSRDFRLLLRWRNLFYLGILLFVLVFATYIDLFSTLKMIFSMYLAFGLLLVRKIDWRISANVTLVVSILAAGILIMGITLTKTVLMTFGDRDVLFFPMLFLEKPAQQWYFNRPFISILVFSLALLATPLRDRKKFVIPFSLLTFLGGLIAISLLFLKGERPRYAMNIQIWFIILIAVGLFVLLSVGGRIVRQKYRWMIWIFILLLFWNIPQTLKASADTQTGWHAITNEYHADIGTALTFLNSSAKIDEAIVTTGYLTAYDEFFEIAGLEQRIVTIYDPYSPNSSQRIYDAIDTHPAGWIILDKFRGNLIAQPVPLHDFVHNGAQVEFLGRFGDVFILKW
jgi:hypothetical protein